jgi:formate C-acetyltransferase
MKFAKAQFCTEEGRRAFTALTKTYFRNGGQTLQINVLSREDLINAQKNPDEYKNLIVRVGGFSEYFTRLAEPLQDNIIKRTEN